MRGQEIQSLGALQGALTGVVSQSPGARFITQMIALTAGSSDVNIGVLAGTFEGLIDDGKDKVVSEISDKAKDEADKVATDAAAAVADPNAEGAQDVATDEASQADAVEKSLDTAADDIEAKSKELAEEAVKNIADAAIATGVALATTKLMSAINLSPAKLAKIIAIIKLLEKIPGFQKPITDMKGEISNIKDTAQEAAQSASESVSSAVTGGGD